MAPGLKPAIAVAAAATMLAGCAGGSFGRQLASSLAMQAVDQAIEERLGESPGSYTTSRPMITSTRTDPALLAFMLADLPVTPPPAETTAPARPVGPAPSARVSKLLTVEVLGFVPDAEKNAILARHGSAPVAAWRLAEGSAEGDAGQMLFLVPPELDGMKHGDITVIELDAGGGLAVARHRL